MSSSNRYPLPEAGGGAKSAKPVDAGQLDTPGKRRSRPVSRAAQKRRETLPPVARSLDATRSATARFAIEHAASRQVRCPACRAAAGNDCHPPEVRAEIRHRGRRWHHAARHALARRFDLSSHAQRAEKVARVRQALHASSRPKPAPGPPPPRVESRARLDERPAERLSSALAGLTPGTAPEVVQAALAAAGLHLSRETVTAWLTHLGATRATTVLGSSTPPLPHRAPSCRHS